MQLVEQHIIDRHDARWAEIDRASWLSKNLYNAANYLVRQAYIFQQHVLSYEYLDKECARLQQMLPDEQYTSWRIEALTDKRNRRIEAYLHRASRRIINGLVFCNIGTLVIGKNDGWKQNIPLGKRTNQNFVQIPHARFIEMLTYKAELAGIQVTLVEESYTAKCSFLDDEPIGKHKIYAGRRIMRGLFQASGDRIINADVNASYNIMRKAIPNALRDGIEAVVVQPLRVTPV
ncbi:MAG: IS200/IS605 family accessory protein TnpB-related protein [Anaerolineae bacterium]|nr:IS200/IS605 family accessory protein TnpB-related protein [Anaerolineae bacterium]